MSGRGRTLSSCSARAPARSAHRTLTGIGGEATVGRLASRRAACAAKAVATAAMALASAPSHAISAYPLTGARVTVTTRTKGCSDARRKLVVSTLYSPWANGARAAVAPWRKDDPLRAGIMLT